MSSKQVGPLGARGRGPVLAPVAPGHSQSSVRSGVASPLFENFEANKT